MNKAFKKLLLYIGVTGRGTLCEKFPDDEDHGGLDEMLCELISSGDLDDFKEDVGFYWATFNIEHHERISTFDYDVEAMLVIEKIEPAQSSDVCIFLQQRTS